jgi:hypothetical protein
MPLLPIIPVAVNRAVSPARATDTARAARAVTVAWCGCRPSDGPCLTNFLLRIYRPHAGRRAIRCLEAYSGEAVEVQSDDTRDSGFECIERTTGAAGGTCPHGRLRHYRPAPGYARHGCRAPEPACRDWHLGDHSVLCPRGSRDRRHARYDAFCRSRSVAWYAVVLVAVAAGGARVGHRSRTWLVVAASLGGKAIAGPPRLTPGTYCRARKEATQGALRELPPYHRRTLGALIYEFPGRTQQALGNAR